MTPQPNQPPAAPRLTGRMTVVCSWCPGTRIIGHKACLPEKDGELTHGICPRCLARFIEEKGLEPAANNSL